MTAEAGQERMEPVRAPDVDFAIGKRRLDRVRALLAKDSRDRVSGRVAGHVLITSPDDIRWLCGFSGSHGWLIVGHDCLVLITDGRYTEQARIEARSIGADLEVLEISPTQKMGDLVKTVITRSSLSVGLFFQPRALDVARYRDLETAIGSSLHAMSSEIDHVRRHKDSIEIAAIARAAEVADRALLETAPMLLERPTERDVRDELDYRMRRLGADGPSYDTIVAAGPVNSAKPHHHPDTTVIEEGHSVVIDVGALVDGYHSDMTRTFLIGDVDPDLRRLYDIVRDAQARAAEAVAPGVPCREIDRVCREIFENFGVEELFIHGTGHGVGLAIHEEPFLGRTTNSVLEIGDVVTVEPGLYRMGLGGVRIEDLLVVTQDAHRCLSSLPKDPSCLPSPPTI